MNNKSILILFLILLQSSFVFAEIPIYCPKCKTHLYNYQKEVKLGESVKAKDFLPANDLIPQPQENTPMECPLDNSPLNGWEYWGKLQNFKEFKLVYPALSLLTKDKDGKWIWIPEDMPQLNLNEEK